MKQREACDNAVKKAYKSCGGTHGKCKTARGQKATWYKATFLKSIISMITPVDELINKGCILDEQLGNDNNKEYRVCPFIDKKSKIS